VFYLFVYLGHSFDSREENFYAEFETLLFAHAINIIQLSCKWTSSYIYEKSKSKYFSL